jgi:hypothetical protein
LTLLKPLLYFSLFRYPLTEEEIYAFSEAKNRVQFKNELDALTKDNIIYKIDGFYLCENNKELVERRLLGNKKAKEIHKKATKVSRFISKFPYVEGVGISGSLSKGYYDDDGDFDFFIITTPNRLWIARTLLILYKKIFLLNSRKYFCVNYFISSNSLEIDEKNRFTATELVTLLPMFGNGSFHEFYKQNKWANSFLPNKNISENIGNLHPVKKPFISTVSEKILNTKLGNIIDNFFLRITYKKWKLKFKNLDEDQFKVALKSSKNVSKHHPLNFQNQVIVRLNKKYLEYQENHNIHLPKEHA